MCLSMVYRNKVDSSNLIARDVATISQAGDELVFADLLGRQTKITGSIDKVDLLENYIIVTEK